VNKNQLLINKNIEYRIRCWSCIKKEKVLEPEKFGTEIKIRTYNKNK